MTAAAQHTDRFSHKAWPQPIDGLTVSVSESAELFVLLLEINGGWNRTWSHLSVYCLLSWNQVMVKAGWGRPGVSLHCNIPLFFLEDETLSSLVLSVSTMGPSTCWTCTQQCVFQTSHFVWAPIDLTFICLCTHIYKRRQVSWRLIAESFSCYGYAQVINSYKISLRVCCQTSFVCILSLWVFVRHVLTPL